MTLVASSTGMVELREVFLYTVGLGSFFPRRLKCLMVSPAICGAGDTKWEFQCLPFLTAAVNI